MPYYYAVAVDDPNFAADAVWQPYTGAALTVNLGPTEGWHNVAVGLRGYGGGPNDAVWSWRRIKLDFTPPVVTITQPALASDNTATVAQPAIQVQGSANESLSSVTFDVNNANGLLSGQTGYVTGQYYDTNLNEFTTTYFQCYDVPLTPGLNTVTVHATDLAGNVTATQMGITLDYSTATTPTTTVTWPPAGTPIGGTNFTLQAQVSDPTATVTATIMDAGGHTYSVTGTPNRNGIVQIPLPAGSGANNVTLTTTGPSGLSSSSSSFALTGADVGLILNPLPANELNQPSVTVSGAIGSSSYSVSVNGVTATTSLDPNGNPVWTADNVPVSPTGTAVFNVNVYDNNGVLIASQTIYGQQPPLVHLVSYELEHTENDSNNWCQTSVWDLENWSFGTGGSISQGNLISCYSVYNNTDFEISTDGWWFTDPWGDPPMLFGYPYYSPWDYEDAPGENFKDGDLYWWQFQWRAKAVLDAGDGPVGGDNKTYLVRGRAMGTSPAWWTKDQDGAFNDDVPLPPESLQIQGQPLINSGITSDVGAVWGATSVSAPPGAQPDVTVTLTPTEAASRNCYWFDEQAIEIPPPTTDVNRDGSISFDGNDDTSPAKPFRFWLNNFLEGGDISSASAQIPGNGGANYTGNLVNGASDLVNFFPAALNLNNVLQWLPLTNGFEYHLSQADNAIKFAYTSLDFTNAFDYLTNLANATYYAVGSGFSVPASGASTFLVTSSGVVLSPDFLNLILSDGNKGVILMEGCNYTTKPLMLEIWYSGQKLASVPMYLNISGIESMFRHLNLRDGPDAPSNLPGPPASGDVGVSSQMNEPQGLPDNLSDGSWMVFVHGYNVSAQNSRGWESEVFKRLYWSHSHSKFIGVDWLGNPIGPTWTGHVISDYYFAEMNAYPSASQLAVIINPLTGPKTIVGHSLGCGVVCFGLNDFGLQANHVCLIDAALASETFDGDNVEELGNMAYSPWTVSDGSATPNYPRSLWASDWYKLFQGTSDARQTLTWKNRFSNAPAGIINNFFSSTEDVLGNFTGPPTMGLLLNIGNGLGFYAWSIQEKSKGNMISLFGAHLVGSDYCGWGFNLYDGYLPQYPIWYVALPGGRRVQTPAEIGSVTSDMLTGSEFNPLFNNGWGAWNANNPSQVYVNTDSSYFTGPNWILGLYDATEGNTIAADPVKRMQLLAQAFPALSTPMGSSYVVKLTNGRNYDMPQQFATPNAPWPEGTMGTTQIPIWHHSDMLNVAYPFLFGLYNQIITISKQ